MVGLSRGPQNVSSLAKISEDECSVFSTVKIRKHITFPLKRIFMAEVDEIPYGLTGDSHAVKQLSFMTGD